MTPSDVPVEGQEGFAPNVAADLVRASLANGGGIHGVVNGQVIGGGNPPRGRNQATAMGAEAGVSADGKTKSTVAGKWSLQDLLATALQKTDPANWPKNCRYLSPPAAGNRLLCFRISRWKTNLPSSWKSSYSTRSSIYWKSDDFCR